MSEGHNQRAIVIGSSIAGLLSARILSEHFASVIVIERDRLPIAPNARRGVPQSVQPHILLARGYEILQELFPIIGTELTQKGATKIDWAREFYHYDEAGWSANAQSPSDIVSFTCSRPLIEWTIRQQVAQLQNVQILEGCRVTNLIYNRNQRCIIGVSVRSADNTLDNLAATLVVDASGRSSKAPQWLEKLGFTPPPETVVNPDLGYATRRYKEPNGFQAPWKVLLISHSPPDNPRLGYLARIEGGEWIATLGGYGQDFPPLDPSGFLEFARSLLSPEFYQAIKEAEPTSLIIAHRATANRLRHYEKVQLPGGFIALGDAVCALFPVYGQGMTVSALGAMVLQDWLRKSNQPVLDGNQLQKKLAKSNALPWSVASSQDSRFSTTKGRIESKSQLATLLEWYSQRLLKKATSSPNLHTLLLEVTQMLKSPIWLYHPAVMFQVLSKE